MIMSARVKGGFAGRIIIFSNTQPPAPLRDLILPEIQIVNIPFLSRPPQGFYGAFNASWFMLDCMNWLARIVSSEEAILILDPDCFIAGNLDPVFEAVRRAELLALRLDYPVGYRVNGICRLQLSELSKICFQGQDEISVPEWLGGEILGLTGSILREITSEFETAISTNFGNLNAATPRANTEEHFLSALIYARQMKFVNAGDQCIARLWTTGRFRYYDPDDLGKPIWHLPAEKSRGFKVLGDKLARADWRERLAELTPIDLSRTFSLRGDRIREAAFLFHRARRELVTAIRGGCQMYKAVA